MLVLVVVVASQEALQATMAVMAGGDAGGLAFAGVALVTAVGVASCL